MAQCPNCSHYFRVREDEQLDITDCPACGYSEKEEVIGECAGCGETISAKDDWYEVESILPTDEAIIVHQNARCCQHYVADMSMCRGGGE